MMQQAIAYGTGFLSLTVGLAQPRIVGSFRLGPTCASFLGVLVLLLTRIVSPGDVADSFQALWRPFLTIVSIVLTTSVAQRLGILTHFIRLLEVSSRGCVVPLFRAVFVLSALVSAILNNDAAVLVLSPLIVSLLRQRYPDRPDLIVPFAFAVFSASGVAPLVISNPINLIVAEYTGIGFNEYALRMIPIAVAGWVASYGILRLVFRAALDLPSAANSTGPRTATRLSGPAKQFAYVMLVVIGSYPVLSYAGWPVWTVALAGAAIGWLLVRRHGIASSAMLAASLPWGTLLFLFCAFVIVTGLRNVGLTDVIAQLYSHAPGSAAQIVTIGTASALGSALLNNHPMAMLNALTLADLPGATKQHVLAALIGGDLGPRLLPTGSLAGLLWLQTLLRDGVHIVLSRFVSVGAAVAVPTLALSLLILLLAW
jgi:arsenical pump membrane protein